MFDAAEIIGLYAETPLHPGSGATQGAVDLPVQRETHTGIPLIPASSLKGVLRDVAERKLNTGGKTDNRIAEIFGPEKGDEYGGALAPTDARLLLFPVRSLEGIFVWVTCPLVIQRFVRDLALLKDQAAAQPLAGLQEISANNDEALMPPVDGRSIPLTNPLVLEEYEYKKVDEPKLASFVSEIAELMPNTVGYGTYQSRLSTHLAVISDTDFQHVVRTGTEIVTRIKLNERKTTTGGDGNMWTEEFLPSDCLFYSLLLAMPSRKNGANPLTGQAVLNILKSKVKPEIIQIGGDETVGRGWTRLRWFNSPAPPGTTSSSGGKS